MADEIKKDHRRLIEYALKNNLIIENPHRVAKKLKIDKKSLYPALNDLLKGGMFELTEEGYKLILPEGAGILNNKDWRDLITINETMLHECITEKKKYSLPVAAMKIMDSIKNHKGLIKKLIKNPNSINLL